MATNWIQKPPRKQPGSPPGCGGKASGGVSAGPVRATKAFGLRPSPSTPQLQGKFWRLSPSAGMVDRSVNSSYSESLTEMKSNMRSPSVAAVIRRSASFDTIATQYLSGEWPRGGAVEQCVVITDQAPPTRGANWLTESSSLKEVTSSTHLNRSVVTSAVISMSDKWTQTVDDMDDFDTDSLKRRASKRSANALTSTSPDIRTRFSKGSISGQSRGLGVRCSPILSGMQPLSGKPPTGTGAIICVPRSNAIAIPVNHQRQPFTAGGQGSSAEGFNQEIEKLVHNTGIEQTDRLDITKARATTPDGHRAPLAEFLNMRNVNTQTPSGGGSVAYCIDKHFLRIAEDTNPDEDVLSEDSPSCQFGRVESETRGVDVMEPLEAFKGTARSDVRSDCDGRKSTNNQRTSSSSTSSSPDQLLLHFVKSSPHIRQPPEGCERVEGKLAVEMFKYDSPLTGNPAGGGPTSSIPAPTSSPVKVFGVPRCHIPSERSAFCPLLKNYVSHQQSAAIFTSFSSTNQVVPSRIEAQ